MAREDAKPMLPSARDDGPSEALPSNVMWATPCLDASTTRDTAGVKSNVHCGLGRRTIAPPTFVPHQGRQGDWGNRREMTPLHVRRLSLGLGVDV